MAGLLRALKGATGSSRRERGQQKNDKLVQGMMLDRSHILSPEQVQLQAPIGEGGFAKVYRCSLEGKAAVTKVITAEAINEEMTYLLTNECTIWSRLSHHNIVAFFGLASTPVSIWLVCEFFADGSLQERNEQRRKSRAEPMPDGQLLLELRQIARGMQYLHALEPPVLHRDLKSANILATEGGSRLAIADFGLARYQAKPGEKNMTAETGSYRWMAPEVIRHEPYDSLCDVYSFGILSWELLTYRVPYEKLMPVEAAFAVAREAKRPPIPPWCSAPVRQMIECCWMQEAAKRPRFSELCSALDVELEMMNAAGSVDATDGGSGETVAVG